MTDRAARAAHCRNLLDQLSRYIDGELHDVDRRAVTLHLKRCPCCEELVDGLRRTVLVCREAGRRRLPREVRVRARARIATLLAEGPQPAPARRK
jgi:anti-sigma factor RsiW